MAKKLKTKTEDIRKLSDADLKKQTEEAYRRLMAMRISRATGQLANHRELPQLRRQIARLRTIARERELQGAGATPAVAGRAKGSARGR
jgi:large subunit ribosomal protein L29